MPVTKAQAKATEKYMQKFDDIKLRVPKGMREIYRERAAKEGKSLNQYIIECIEKNIKE